MRQALVLPLLMMSSLVATAQWTLQDSGTKASLRGIHSLGKGVAWASGTGGTVLRTEDGGAHWQQCAMPPNAEKLDFRGVQAFDAQTAIVMSSGKGDLSRLYKTVDGCATWTLTETNPDADGFWDGIVGNPAYNRENFSVLTVGDPVAGHFAIFRPERVTKVTGSTMVVLDTTHLVREVVKADDVSRQAKEVMPLEAESLFAASNSSYVAISNSNDWAFGTGGVLGPRVVASVCRLRGEAVECRIKTSKVPMARGPAAGIFSIAGRWQNTDCISEAEYRKMESRPLPYPPPRCHRQLQLVAVGGDYTKPDMTTGTAAYVVESESDFDLTSQPWSSSDSLPHGYRSGVAYDGARNIWITVGPNGTDISNDDGRNWRALRPGPGEPVDADKDWNALSLPFVVGPKGRIGVLRADALKAPTASKR